MRASVTELLNHASVGAKDAERRSGRRKQVRWRSENAGLFGEKQDFVADRRRTDRRGLIPASRRRSSARGRAARPPLQYSWWHSEVLAQLCLAGDTPWPWPSYIKLVARCGLESGTRHSGKGSTQHLVSVAEHLIIVLLAFEGDH